MSVRLNQTSEGWTAYFHSQLEECAISETCERQEEALSSLILRIQMLRAELTESIVEVTDITQGLLEGELGHEDIN